MLSKTVLTSKSNDSPNLKLINQLVN